MQKKGGYNAQGGQTAGQSAAAAIGGEMKLTEKNLDESIQQQYEFEDIQYVPNNPDDDNGSNELKADDIQRSGLRKDL